jgi:biotin operon repressor
LSHEATNWAIKQKGLKAATKVVLLALADCHNPHYGCFPSKKTLADDCEMSERTVYTHIKTLETAGLITTSSNFDRSKGQFASTRYMLAFEQDFRRKELPSEDSAVGNLQHLPSAKIADCRRQKLPNNPVSKPCNETSKERDALLAVLSPSVADGFIAHRKSKRAKLTPHAAELIAEKLKGHSDPDAVVNNSIMNGWTGVFPEKTPQPAAAPVQRMWTLDPNKFNDDGSIRK